MEAHGIELVSRALIIQNDAVLVCQARGKGAYYFFPGGHIEHGETVQESLIRELHEETGLDLTVGHFIGAFENFFRQDGEKHHEYNFVFTASLGTTTVRSRESHISFTWIPLGDFAQTEMQPKGLHRCVVQWLDDKGIFWDTQAEKK